MGISKDTILITVQGADKTGKGNVIAAITRALENHGAVVTVQSAETHNKSKLGKSAAELAGRLQGCPIAIIEQNI